MRSFCWEVWVGGVSDKAFRDKGQAIRYMHVMASIQAAFSLSMPCLKRKRRNKGEFRTGVQIYR